MGGSSAGTDDGDVTDRGADHRVLFPVDGDVTDAVLDMVAAIVTDLDATLYLGAPVQVPNQTPLDTPQLQRRGERMAAQYALQIHQHTNPDGWVETVVDVGHRRTHILEDLVDTHDIQTLITDGSAAPNLESRLGIEGIDNTAIDGTCDTIYLTRVDTVDAIDSVVVPVADGPHAAFAVQVGTAIARHHDTTLELFHVYEPDGKTSRAAGRSLLDRARQLVDDYDAVETTLRGSFEHRTKVLEYTDDAAVTVLGAPREGLLRQYVQGSIPATVGANTDGIVITTHRGGTETSWLERWL
ncbi:MAG: universal stress protein [Halobacteriaceae archaeon]